MARRLWPKRGTAEAPKATIRVVSDPNGAEVLIDGERIGVTPVDHARVEPGDRELEIKKEGFATYRVRIYVGEAGGAWSAVLEPVGNARLKVTSDPSGALVYVDGHAEGHTPLDVGRLLPGKRNVRVAATGFEPWHKTIELTQGRTATLHAKLEDAMILRLEQELETAPGNLGVRAKLAHYHLASGDADAAEPILAGAWRLARGRTWDDDGFRQLREVVAKDYAKEGRPEKPGREVRSMLEGQMLAALVQQPQNSRLIGFVADVLMTRPGGKAATRVLEQFARSSPNNTPALMALARLYVHNGQTDAAVQVLERARQAAGRDWRVLRALAGAYEAAGKRSAAVKTLKQALLHCDDAAARAAMRAKVKGLARQGA